MAVYIELQPIDNKPKGGAQGNGRRARAGIPNVRRPLKGIERKSDTYAYISVLQGDGTSSNLVDSSQRSGEGPEYANFLLQSVQEARIERQQIVETFGAPYVFFFGESPRFADISAVLLDSQDFNWHAEWWENYEKKLRGTRLAERGATALLHYDDVILEGYFVQAVTNRASDNQHLVQLQLRMFITNYVNVSNIGDPNFPIREEAILPEQTTYDDRTFAFRVDPGIQEREAAFNALRTTAAAAIRRQIQNARSIQRVRQLQLLHAMKELGMEPQGANLLTVGKSLFQGVVAAVRGENETLDEAKQRLADEAKKLLTLSQQGDTAAVQELLGIKKEAEKVDQLTAARGVVTRSLQETLRNAARYTAASPIADLNAFLQRIQAERFKSGTTQVIEPRRTFPIRSVIADNYEEYTQFGEDPEYIGKVMTDRIGAPAEGSATSLPSSVNDAVTSMGGTPTPASTRAMNMYSWSPGKGLQKSTAPFDTTGYPDSPDRYTYSKRWGSTPDAGGSYGGLLGGAGGKGIGGKAPSPDDFFQVGSGLPQADPYGNPNLPPYAYTDGYGPDGQELYKKQFQYGPKEGASLFGGSAVVKEIDKKNDQGNGSFTIVVLEGELL